MQTRCQSFRNKEKKPYTFRILIIIGINNNKYIPITKKKDITKNNYWQIKCQRNSAAIS